VHPAARVAFNRSPRFNNYNEGVCFVRPTQGRCHRSRSWKPGPDEVVARSTDSSICTSDVHPVARVVAIPVDRTLGHESVGIVHRVGSGVTTVREGDRVASGCITPSSPRVGWVVCQDRRELLGAGLRRRPWSAASCRAAAWSRTRACVTAPASGGGATNPHAVAYAPLLTSRFGWSGPHPVPSCAEDSPSGLGRTIGNRVGVDSPSRVQIPHPPPPTRHNTWHPRSWMPCVCWPRRAGLSLGLTRPATRAGHMVADQTRRLTAAVATRSATDISHRRPAGSNLRSSSGEQHRTTPAPRGGHRQAAGHRMASGGLIEPVTDQPGRTVDETPPPTVHSTIGRI
jgi:hypothetical protein